MGGGGGGSTTTNKYQSQRKGVNKRQYDQVASNGIQSQEEYEAIKNHDPKYVNYDSTYGTYSLKNGVDAEAAIKDYENYMAERTTQAKYDAQNATRLSDPTSLNGTSQASLAIDTETNSSGTSVTTKKKKATSTTANSVASTNQPLGIY